MPLAMAGCGYLAQNAAQGQCEGTTQRREDRRERDFSTANGRNPHSPREFGIVLPTDHFAEPFSRKIIVGQNHVLGRFKM
jgi:hypothetical protein